MTTNMADWYRDGFTSISDMREGGNVGVESERRVSKQEQPTTIEGAPIPVTEVGCSNTPMNGIVPPAFQASSGSLGASWSYTGPYQNSHSSLPHASAIISSPTANIQGPATEINGHNITSAKEDVTLEDMHKAAQFTPINSPISPRRTSTDSTNLVETQDELQSKTYPTPALSGPGVPRDGDDEDVSSTSTSSSEALYCICNDVEFGQMIKCDNNCAAGWFHFVCVELHEQDVPSEDEKWYCPDCRNELGVDMLGTPLRKARGTARRKKTT